MSVSKPVASVETQSQRDARVEALWARLDPERAGELDIKGLRKGLRSIDHRERPPPARRPPTGLPADARRAALRNADGLLRQIMADVDTNRDGKIQFDGMWRRPRPLRAPWLTGPEFRAFVEQAERQLLILFRAIDRDGDGRLGRAELQTAFGSAGLTVSKRRLDDFIGDMDKNHDGYIGFQEWRCVPPFLPLRTLRPVGRAVARAARPDSRPPALARRGGPHDPADGMPRPADPCLAPVTFCSLCRPASRARSCAPCCPTTSRSST